MKNYNHNELELLRDRLAEIDPDLIGQVLRTRGKDLRNIADSIVGNLPRTALSIALKGLIDRTGIEIERLASTPHDVENAARAVRNCLESNLIGRYVLDSKENLENWFSLRAKEEIDVLSSALKVFGKDSSQERKIIEDRVIELKELAKKHNMINPKQLPRWRDMATNYDLLEDYEGLYGVFSKYVHPCAWLIVKADSGYAAMFTQIFVVHAQVYAADLTERALEALKIKEFSLSETSWGNLGEPRVTH